MGFLFAAAYRHTMEVRAAVEEDAETVGAIADAPVDAMRNLIHDRSVRVAVERSASDPNEDAGGAGAPEGEETLVGFVSFDARPDAVHVTQLAGTADACERLLGEPIEFARGEGMAVELLVPDADETVQAAAERVGFDRDGSGPRFEGQRTTRFRLEP